MKKIANKVVAAILAVLTIVSLAMPAFAAKNISWDPTTGAKDWSPVTSLGIAYKPFNSIDTASAKIWAPINAASNNLSSMATGTIDVSNGIKEIAEILVYMDWISKNAAWNTSTDFFDLLSVPYVDPETAAISDEEVFRKFTTDTAEDGSTIYSIPVCIELVRQALNETDNFTNGEVNVQDALPDLSTMAGTLSQCYDQNGTNKYYFVNCDAFRGWLIGIITNYYERLIYVNAAKELTSAGIDGFKAESGNSAFTTYDELKSAIDAASTDVVYQHHDGYLQYMRDLSSIFQLFEEVSTYYLPVDNSAGNTSRTLTIGDVKYTVYKKNRPDQNRSVEDSLGLSGKVKELYERFAGVSSGDTAASINDKTSGITVDPSQGSLNKLSNATIQNDQIIVNSSDGVADLTNLGYYMLAAGAVYNPFSSVAGNDAYIDVVSEFLNDPEQKEDLQHIIQVAVNTKKPLMVTTGKESSWVAMEDLETIKNEQYKYAFLSDAIDLNDGSTKAYVIVKGKMSPSAVDGNTWEYVNKGSSRGSARTTPSTETATMDTSDSQVEFYSDNADSYSTVATDLFSASGSQVTVPVMVTAGKERDFYIFGYNGDTHGFTANVGGLTAMIIRNALEDVKDNQHLKNAEKETLWVNGMGDIVLSDNTVILPAIANPLMYNYSMDFSEKTEEEIKDMFVNDTDDWSAYYPYTVAFMNHYPALGLKQNGTLKFVNNTFEGRYIVGLRNNVLKCYKILKDNIDSAGAVAIGYIYANSFSIDASGSQHVSLLRLEKSDKDLGVGYFGGGDHPILEKIPIIGSWGKEESGYVMHNDGSIVSINGNYFMTRGALANSENQLPFFPLEDTGIDTRSTFVQNGAIITQSALRFISKQNEADSGFVTNGRFRSDVFVREFIGEAFLGTQYAEVMQKNVKTSYDDIVADTGNRFLKFVIWITDSAIEHLGKINGVLAVSDAYDNTFFNIIVNFIQEFYMIIALCLMTVVAVRFFKGHYNSIYVVFIGLVVVAGFEVYANWLPNVLPSLYNLVVNDAVEQIVWNTLGYSAEKYEETYKDPGHVDPVTGKSRPYTSTITLYTMTNGEMSNVAGRLNVPISDVVKGKQLYLDEQAGIFVQGNKIKMSVDRLFSNNTMRGLYQSQWEELGANLENADAYIEPIKDSIIQNPYSIQLIRPYTSLESYYMPYNHIERAFMMNLNTFTDLFRLERFTFTYDDGRLYKDAFVTRCFIRSGIFTAPGDNAVLRENVQPNSVAGDVIATPDELVALANTYFAPQRDWLNLRIIFAYPDAGVRGSLWGSRMQAKGWYDYEWNMTELGDKKLTEMIEYINSLTKDFVIQNQDLLYYCSDENAIKIISLYATTCFSQYLSDFGHWMYPNYVDAASIELKDVLYSSMTTMEDRNFAYDGTVTNTVGINIGIFGVLFILLITVFSTLFLFFITYLIPVLYGLFGGVLVFKLINGDHAGGLVRGYGFVTVVSVALYVAYNYSLCLVELGGYKWYAYLGCAVVCFLCLYFLLYTILSVIQDIEELGANTLFHNLARGLNRLTGGVLDKIAGGRLNISNNQSNYSAVNVPFGIDAFRHKSNVDRYNNIQRGRRNTGYHGYGRGEGYDETTTYTNRVMDYFSRRRENNDSSEAKRKHFWQRQRPFSTTYVMGDNESEDAS